MKNYMLGVVAFFFVMTLGKQEINTNESRVTFEVMKMKVNKVEGSFKGMKGDVNFNPDDLKNSSFEVTIDVASVDTDNSLRDKHLRSEDFFEVEKYPTIKFKSSSIVRSKKQSYYIAKGKLTIRDVTKDIKIPFTYENNTFQGNLSIDRFTYDVGKGISASVVSKEVTVKITCKTE